MRWIKVLIIIIIISGEIKLQMTPETHTALLWRDFHNHIHVNPCESFCKGRGKNTTVSVSRAEEPAPPVFSPCGFGSHCSPESSVVLSKRRNKSLYCAGDRAPKRGRVTRSALWAASSSCWKLRFTSWGGNLARALLCVLILCSCWTGSCMAVWSLKCNRVALTATCWARWWPLSLYTKTWTSGETIASMNRLF